MKRRRGDQQRGSSGSLRVVLGATLALAGDSARRELTPADSPAPDPPREAKKARRPEKLPEPRFAEKAAPAPKRKAAQKRTAKPKVRPPALREDALPVPAFAAAAPVARSNAEPAPTGVLSAEFRRAITPEPVAAPPLP
ncbi:MAG: hypothetical protein B7Z22_14465, partial [Hyphomonas sp. 32-62-5]